MKNTVKLSMGAQTGETNCGNAGCTSKECNCGPACSGAHCECGCSH